MHESSILVVEDDEPWQEVLREILEQFEPDLQADFARSYDEAHQYITDNSYDLAIVDLSLLRNSSSPEPINARGMDLLDYFRQGARNKHTGLIVLTAYYRIDLLHRAFLDYRVDEFIDKSGFDDQLFVQLLQKAIRQVRFRRATDQFNTQYRLSITFNGTRLVRSELRKGMQPQRNVEARPDRDFNALDLVRRGDNINWMITQGTGDLWREEAKSVGAAIHAALEREQTMLSELNIARTLPQRSNDLVLQWSGPPTSLPVPFELLRDGDDYLCFAHPIIRHLDLPQYQGSRREPFHVFVEDLLHQGSQLRILVVGANADGLIPEAEQEAADLCQAIAADLQRWGIGHQITALIGDDATHGKVVEALQSRQYHVFHYAGHGRFNDKLAEISSLILRDDQGKLRPLTAAQIRLLVQNSNLRFAFLSGCFSARTASQVGRGDFYGILESFARGGVPAVFGYRWMVNDDSARQFALNFYQALWRTFLPTEALFQARHSVAISDSGLDDDTWASPILLLQHG